MAETRNRKRGAWLLGLLLFGVFISICSLVCFLFVFGISEAQPYGMGLPGVDRIALVEIRGTILDSTEVLDQLQHLSRRTGVKAIVVRLESPGGSVVASQEIYRELIRIREQQSLVILVSMGNVAASGAYYIACAADLIMANPGSITGSIGVIASWTQYGELLRWAKMTPVTFKSGPYKDAASSTRDLTPEDIAFHQSLVDELHEQFLQAVMESRDFPEQKIREFGDGRVFTGSTALSLGLVDELGNLSDAIDRAAGLAGIEGTPKVLRVRKDSSFDFIDLFGKFLLEQIGRVSGRYDVGSPSGYQYLWAPQTMN